MNITYRGTKLETPEYRAVVQLHTDETLYVMCGCNQVTMRYKYGGWVVDYCENITVERIPANDGFRDSGAQQRLMENIYGG